MSNLSEKDPATLTKRAQAIFAAGLIKHSQGHRQVEPGLQSLTPLARRFFN